MISYHPLRNGQPAAYASGFVAADTNDTVRLANGISSHVWSPCVWRDGKRLEKNFALADWVALDFDDGEMTLDQALNSFCDMAHIIGTTKSHQRPKNGKPPCDRFRVALRLEARCEDLATFRATMRKLTELYAVDPAAKDAARFFYPCVRVVSFSDDGYRVELAKAPTTADQELRADTRVKLAKLRYARSGTLPGWVRGFLDHGRLCRAQGRNNTIYAVAVELAKLGIAEHEIKTLVEKAPIAWDGLSPRAVESTIRSATKRS